MDKILIIDCSPKVNGNTSYLIKIFKEHLSKKCRSVRLFPNGDEKGVLPCLDCGACIKNPGCILNDDFKDVVNDDYDAVLFASPIYMSNLPGPAFNLISRFNYLYNNKKYLDKTYDFKEKRAVLFLTGGGNASKSLQGVNNEDLAIKSSKYIFKKLNANLKDDDILLCLNTDDIEISQNKEVIDKVISLAKSCN